MSKKKKSYTVRTNIAIPNKYGYMKCPVEESDFIDSYDAAMSYSQNVYQMFNRTGSGVFRKILVQNDIYEFTPKERKYHEKHRKELNI